MIMRHIFACVPFIQLFKSLNRVRIIIQMTDAMITLLTCFFYRQIYFLCARATNDLLVYRLRHSCMVLILYM